MTEESIKHKEKPCCVCRETRQIRDECFLRNGDQAETKCAEIIKAHRECMKSYGFTVN